MANSDSLSTFITKFTRKCEKDYIVSSTRGDYPSYVPEGCQLCNDQFIREFVKLSIRYFAWLRTQPLVNRHECQQALTKKLVSMFKLNKK